MGFDTERFRRLPAVSNFMCVMTTSTGSHSTALLPTYLITQISNVRPKCWISTILAHLLNTNSKSPRLRIKVVLKNHMAQSCSSKVANVNTIPLFRCSLAHNARFASHQFKTLAAQSRPYRLRLERMGGRTRPHYPHYRSLRHRHRQYQKSLLHVMPSRSP
jgi:hypothetical protein